MHDHRKVVELNVRVILSELADLSGEHYNRTYYNERIKGDQQAPNYFRPNIDIFVRRG